MEEKDTHHAQIVRCAATLKKAGVKFAKGMSEKEIDVIEARYAFRFPPDYRAFLMYALPVSNGFTDWRSGVGAEIRRRLDWPRDGMLFDIEHNVFWLEAWGERPLKLAKAFAVAREAVAVAPRLIPIRGHRYLTETPHEAGNPVLSVYQTDIIYYGSDIWEYLENEFYFAFNVPQYRLTEPIKRVPFWSDIIEGVGMA